MTDMKEITERVQNSINVVRPYLQNDGGDISLVEVTPEMVVKVQLHGTPAYFSKPRKRNVC